ncbi:hypothetical protein ABL78_2431 [Leptomonas seymouri]|uniref:Uncharacterized protein n=1 Tax=Leptomonas seymouri TaxID=5684 RepID=A0A0N0P776_LEPSE|nr:hypothetical protein ABL78_2431 [Leptomonas seymouri]|eukprot:KPI88469.1 hypothetical protein ABL78_2431 [Leptomonas seymouri]
MQTLDTLSATAPPHASTNAPPLAQSHSNAAFPQSGSISVPPTVSLLNPSQLPTASSIVSQSALLRDCAGAVANKETAALLYSPRSNSSLYTSPLCRYGRVQTAWADKAAEGSAAAPRVAASASSETFSERDSVTAPSFTTNALTLPDWDAHTAGAAAGAGFKRQSAAPCAPPASPGKALTGNAQCCHADDVSHRSLPAAEDAVPLHNADLDIPTVVSATTMHTSSVRMDSSAAEGGSRKNESCCSRGLVARSDDSGNSATPSAAPSLFAGAPPPSGLRDPVTLLQLLSIDLLLQPDDPTSPSSLFAMGGGGRVGGNLSRDGEPLRGALTRVGNPLQQPNTTPLSDYCRAFSLLRCAAKPSSVLSCSRGWQDCRNVDPTRPPDASSVYAALGRVMAELERCHQAGGPPLHANAVLSAFCEDTRAGPRLAEGTVLLCSLAGSVDSAQPHEQCPHAAGVHACDGAHSGDSTVVPLLFFAAAVECPPDIRRYFVVSRTHAYLCEPNGTVAYCAAVQDIRQIVACAGGYMVWRFMPDAMVSTMIARNVGDDKRKATGAAASSTTARGWKPGSASPTQTQRVDSSSPTAPSSGSPKFPAAAGETRDEMSDWVFRILSVGCPRVALAGAAANLPPSGNDGGDPSCAATSSFLNSVQDDRLLEERMSATVFLLNVMCTLRTLPRLLTDALVNGSTAATEADGVSPSSIASAAFSSTQLRSSNANSSSSSCATAAHASALDHPSNACARVSDRLDRMHVAGDRLYRIPLLLEGPAGHQTAVKFIECCWTTRYDQLPPSLRPRRFSAVSYLGSTGAQALPTTLPPLDGDSAAHLCYVESSLLIPPIPVLSLEACLNAEDSVMEMLQASSNALHAAPTAAAANVLNSPEASTATKCCGRTSSDAASLDSIPLRDLADASEKATAKACLSPAAWRVLEQLIHGSGEGATNASDLGGDGRQGEGAAGGSLWLDGNAPTAPLTTSAAASTSVSCHAEASVAAPSRDASTATSGVASHDGEKRGSSPRASFSGSHGPACHPIESPADAAGEASLLEAPHNQRRTADGRDTFGDQHVSAPGSRRMGRTASGSSRVSITVEGALDMPPPQPTPWEGDAAAAADSGDGASPLLSKSLDVARSSTSILRHESSRVSIAQASMKRKLLDSVSKAVMQARLRRQRPDELEEAKGRTHADFSSLGADHPRGGAHNAAPCLPQIGVAVPAMDAESDATSALSLPSPTKVVEDFERRIQHRPLPDRLLLRAHYVERLLKSRLLCSARGGQCIGCSEEEMRPPQRNEPAAAPCPSLVAPTDAFAPLMPEDSGKLLDDLRRQRVIAALMYMQNLESSSRDAAAGAPRLTSSAARPSSPPPPPSEGVAATLEEKMRRRSNMDAFR